LTLIVFQEASDPSFSIPIRVTADPDRRGSV
jgi:hypothetical protein